MFHKYLDPKNDLAFKKIFGEERHKNIPISFLNAVFNLTGEDTIIDLEFLRTTQPPEIEARKESIVDVLVRDLKGTKYIVEMQAAKVEGFEQRAQFYAAKTYCSHFNVGEPYNNLKRVIFLAITSYVMFPDKPHYKSDHVILDNKTYDHDLKDFSFTFVELPKFTKTDTELETIEDKWYYFLKHAAESDEVNIHLASEDAITEAYEVLERTHWSEAEFAAYEHVAMASADYIGGLTCARKEGLQEGLQEGKAIGLEEGKTLGMQEAMTAMARKLRQEGLPSDKITALTGLAPDTIASL